MKNLLIFVVLVFICVSSVQAINPHNLLLEDEEFINQQLSMQVCGDWSCDGFVNIMDVIGMAQFLLVDPPGPISACPQDADCDNYQNITIRDMYFVLYYLYGVNSLTMSCPATNSPLPTGLSESSTTYLHTYQTAFPYAAILPSGQSTYDVNLHFTTDDTINVASLKFSIRVGVDIPNIIDFIEPLDCTDYTICANQTTIDNGNGTIEMIFFLIPQDYLIYPGTHELGTVTLEVPLLVNVWRPIIVEWVNTTDGNGSPWVNNYNNDVFMPSVKTFPCTGIRGNIDGDATETIDIVDLVYLVEYMFGDPTGPPPFSFEEADVNATIALDIQDLVDMVDYMFGSPSGPPPLPCPEF